MNQELEQYLRFFVEHRQKDWPEWLASAECTVNNKTHTTTKVLPFIANYGRESRMGGDIKKGKGRKYNRICGKNEKGIRGSRGSIEEDAGRDEVICR